MSCFPRIRLSIAIVLLAAGPCFAQQPGSRFFTDQTGKFRIRAVVMDLDETNVKLKKADGVEVVVPLNRLSDRDQTFLRDMLQKYKAMVGDFPIGTKVEIKSTGGWYPGEVLQVQPGQYFISFDDYSDRWNKWVTAKELRLIPAEETSAAIKKDATDDKSNEPEMEAIASVPEEAENTDISTPNVPPLTFELPPPTPPVYSHESIQSRRFVGHLAENGWQSPIQTEAGPTIGNWTFQFELSPLNKPWDAFLPSVHRQRALLVRDNQLVALNLTDGTVEWQTDQLPSKLIQPLALSDDGRRLIVSLNDEESRPTGLCVYLIENSSANIEWVWRPVPESHQVSQVQSAFWLKNDRVAVLDEKRFAVWMPETKSQHAIITANSKTPIEFSPASEIAAFFVFGHITIYKTDGIRVLANTEPLRSGVKKVSFAPSGSKLIVSGADAPTIVSLNDGKPLKLESDILSDSVVEWIDDRYTLIDGESIFDTKLNRIVWKFNCTFRGKPAGSVSTLAGKLRIYNDRESKILIRGLFDVIDPEKLKPPAPKVALVRPGAKVAIRVAGSLADKYRQPIESQLEAMAKQNGWIVDPSGPLKLRADVNEVTESIEFETSSIIGFGKKNQTIPVTYGTYRLAIYDGDEPLMIRGFRSLVTTMGVIPRSKTLQQWVNERSEFDIGKIKTVTFPATIEPKTVKEAIGSTDIWTIQ